MPKVKTKRTLKELRKERKLTQLELSSISGVSIGEIRKLEENLLSINNCKATTLNRLCKALKVKIDDLL